MLICIPDILGVDQVARMREEMDRAEWEDGKATAGAQSSLVKVNRQLPVEGDVSRRLGRDIIAALTSNPTFVAAAIPLKIFPPLFNRYDAGCEFGLHIDNSIRGDPFSGLRIRTDLSMTVFLSEPDEYDGGELVVETSFGAQEIKLPAGHAVLYPASSLHLVRPIMRGTRIASFFWIQSMVRSSDARSLIFDLDQSIQGLPARLGTGDPEVVRLTGIYHNALRQWAEV